MHVSRLSTAGAALLLCLLMTAAAARAQEPAYPFTNPYEATIFGTPPDLRIALNGDISPDRRSLEVEERHVPEIFFYNEAMEYSVTLQDGPAPLVFIVAGTGARYDAAKMGFLQQLFHGAGYHTVCLSSPTQFQFIVSMSRHALAGYVPWDVEDLWRVMRIVRDEVASEREITGMRLAGYSLGALQAAFLAERDSRAREFGFERVLMLNPPVDLFQSALRFDSWLGGGEEGMEKAEKILATFIREFTEFYKTNDLGSLDGDDLFRFFRSLELSDDDLRALIASSFRMTSASMIFSSDVCLRAGYVVAPEVELTMGTPLLPYFDVTSRITFEQYVDEFLLPYIQFRDPSATRTSVLHECSLRSIARFLRGADNVAVLGTRDDPILGGDEVNFLEQTFGERLTLFPHGGHCGNFQYLPFAERMLELLRLPPGKDAPPVPSAPVDASAAREVDHV